MLSRSVLELGVHEALVALDGAIDELVRAIDRPAVSAEVARQLRTLRDELDSHALAARVLVASGASDDSVRPVLQRAADLLDRSRHHALISS